MARRIFSLTNVLGAALVVALGLLADALWTALAPSPAVELSENVPAQRMVRVRRAKVVEPPVQEPEATPAPARVVGSTPGAVSIPRPEFPTTTVRGPRERLPSETAQNPVAGVRIHAADGAHGLPMVHLQAEHAAIGAFLLQLARHSTWPDGGPAAGEPFRIGVMRSEIARQSLVASLRGQWVGSSPVVVQGGTPDELLRFRARIVFVPGFALATGASGDLDRWSVLTVTYTGADAADTWCDVEIVQGADEFTLYVDPRAADRKGVAIDARLFEATFVFDRAADLTPQRDAKGRDQPVLRDEPIVPPSGP